MRVDGHGLQAPGIETGEAALKRNVSDEILARAEAALEAPGQVIAIQL